MWLTEQEVAELTGYKRHADQRRWLTAHVWLFEINANGRPVILRGYAEQKLCGEAVKKSARRPDFSHIRKAA